MKNVTYECLDAFMDISFACKKREISLQLNPSAFPEHRKFGNRHIFSTIYEFNSRTLPKIAL